MGCWCVSFAEWMRYTKHHEAKIHQSIPMVGMSSGSLKPLKSSADDQRLSCSLYFPDHLSFCLMYLLVGGRLLLVLHAFFPREALCGSGHGCQATILPRFETWDSLDSLLRCQRQRSLRSQESRHGLLGIQTGPVPGKALFPWEFHELSRPECLQG